MRISLGDIARDSITGFEGVVIARTEWLFGCVRFTLQPQALHDGKPIPTETFDEEQLVWVRSTTGDLDQAPTRSAVSPEPAMKGGPRPAPKCGARLTRPAWTPFVCPVCRKLAHIPGVAKREAAV